MVKLAMLIWIVVMFMTALMGMVMASFPLPM